MRPAATWSVCPSSDPPGKYKRVKIMFPLQTLSLALKHLNIYVKECFTLKHIMETPTALVNDI